MTVNSSHTLLSKQLATGQYMGILYSYVILYIRTVATYVLLKCCKTSSFKILSSFPEPLILDISIYVCTYTNNKHHHICTHML